MRRFQVFGASTPEESRREKEHRALARRAAAEGIVLLKNDGALPLKTRTVALYGPGSRKTVKGGSGSVDVHERYSVTIEEGLKNAGFTFPTTLWMERFSGKYEADIAAWRQDVEQRIKGYGPIRTMQMFDVIHENPMPYPSCTPILEDELTDETDTAIYVLSRQAGEGRDRHVEKGDYLLSDVETESLKILSAQYRKLILVLNCGSVMDLSILDETRVDAVLFYGQGGMEGGNALADVLTGAVNPSGRLADTWAVHYEDYPSANTFGHRNGDLHNEDYAEGIYVGYRWFEKHDIAPRFPFGHGLSYTSFETEAITVSDRAAVMKVTNTGKTAGRETVMLFVQKPDGAFDHEKRSLVGFCKTHLLAPGESETGTISFDLWEVASFEEAANAFVLEAGTYTLYAGDTPCGSFTLKEARTKSIERKPLSRQHSEKTEAVLKTLSDKEKCMLAVGGGYPLRAYNQIMGAAGRTCTKLLKKGVPNIVLSDGPAGLNVVSETAVMKNGVPAYPNGLPDDWRWGWLKHMEGFIKRFLGKGRPVYRYMTAWPSETVLAQSWDTALLEEVGRAVGREMLEIGASVWLAPGLNIHRNPLCGRNFEYCSEDPLVSGKMASAVTRGVQSVGGVGVSIKHFCCNNQEDNRTLVSENVSKRALREIYLRGFEIAVREGKPWTVMSSYNKVNGRHVVNTRELLTNVLREEWGFEGVVMSDWNATDQCSHVEAINAGNDLIMPGDPGVVKTLMKGLEDGTLSRDALETSAARILDLIFQSETCKEFPA